jgi:hypothetical protein
MEFNFKENAQGLLKRIGLGSSSSVNPALALAAVETALREAYAKGLEDARKGTGLSAKPNVTGPKKTATTSSIPNVSITEPREECHHEWQEAFLDGRGVGHKCLKCGVLERDIRRECDHYFVKTDAGEVCVACRRPRRRPGN